MNFCARALSERALAQLHEDEQLTVLLAAEHDAVDFDRVSYMARWEETAKRRSLPPRILARAEQLARDHERHWSRLAALGLAATDVGQTIELERAFLGLTWGWSSSAILRQIFDDAGGAPIGDNVGYGPARLFSNHEVGAMREAIAAIDLPTFAAAYHDGHKAFMTPLGQSYSVAGEWEDFASGHHAMQRLVPYLREAAISGRALLAWFE